MNVSTNPEGRATLARSYRNLSVREIRARLEGSLGEAERVTAQAELLRRGADDDGPDTTFVGGFEPTSAMDIGAVESEPAPEVLAQPGADAAEATRPRRRLLPVVVLALAIAGGLGWAFRAGLIRL
jgi:hypothetical protein